MVQQEFSGMHGNHRRKIRCGPPATDVSRSSLRYGYRTNEAGFGWTNAVFTALFDELPPAAQRNLPGNRR